LNSDDLPNSFTLSGSIVDGISGVHTGPGATAFTRTPHSIASLESPFVKPTMAHLVEA
jgi:hypothetical protein